MASIYSKACCRLAATSSRMPTEPFWPPRPITPSVQIPNLKEEDFHSEGDAEGGSEDNSDINEMYITLPKYYRNDVERGLLNKRGWVLQERLLAPVSIHFTKDHVYYEDADTIIGEDGLARNFSWLSCINKTSETARLNLYPEKRMMSKGNYEASESGEDSWLKIAELFSECKFSYQTDRLLALAGIVKSKQGPTTDAAVGEASSLMERSRGQYTGSNYLVGIWETELHIDLMWAARGDKNLEFLDSLRLPSWSWLAYAGPITFTKDRRSLRENDTVLGEPRSEIRLMDYKVVGTSELLPAKQQSYLVLEATIRSLFTVSNTPAATPSKFETKEEYLARSPFHHDPASSTNPIQLPSLSKCREIYDVSDSVVGNKAKHIGFLSFDDDTRSLRSEDLVLAHVSTLLDGLGPRFRAGVPSAIGYYGRSGPSSLQPILAYALVLSNANGDEYQRVGIAEVNYDWMTAGTESIIKLR